MFHFVLDNNAALIALVKNGNKDLWNASVGNLVSINTILVDKRTHYAITAPPGLS